MKETFRINLNDLRFYSRIGVSDQERKVGNEYVVNVSVAYDASLFQEEDLDSSISYADIYEEIKEEMRIERLLLESTALHISKRISERWEKVEEISVKIDKSAPPVIGIAGNCGIEYFWKKDEDSKTKCNVSEYISL